MLELAHKLADNDTKFFGGWVLAGVEVHIHGTATQLENKTLLAKERKSMLQVVGTAADGSIAKELRVFLVLPKRQLDSTQSAAVKAATEQAPSAKPHSEAKESNAHANAHAGTLLAEHVFTVDEVRNYVAFTGDENIIHKGEHPIVPGLCMTAWLQSALAARELDWRVSFLAPVFTGDTLCVYQNGAELQAYVGSSNVFTIKL